MACSSVIGRRSCLSGVVYESIAAITKEILAATATYSAILETVLLGDCLELGLVPGNWHCSKSRSSNANSFCRQNSAGSPQILRPFKGIICGDISEFESHMLSHAVRYPSSRGGAKINVARADGREHPAGPAGGLSIYGSRCPPISSHG